jgi:hypothetical protein
MNREKKIIIYIVLFLFTQIDSEEIIDFNKLSRNDSFSPHTQNNLYQGPYGRILSLAELKKRILVRSKMPYLIREKDKYYKFMLHEREYLVWITAKGESIEIKLKKQENYFPIILSISKRKGPKTQWYANYNLETDINERENDFQCSFLNATGEREAAEIYGRVSDLPYNSLYYEWKCANHSNTLSTYKIEIVKDGKEVFIYNIENKLIPLTSQDQKESWLYNPLKIDARFNFKTCLYEYLYNGKIDHNLCKKFGESIKK